MGDPLFIVGGQRGYQTAASAAKRSIKSLASVRVMAGIVVSVRLRRTSRRSAGRS